MMDNYTLGCKLFDFYDKLTEFYDVEEGRRKCSDTLCRSLYYMLSAVVSKRVLSMKCKNTITSMVDVLIEDEFDIPVIRRIQSRAAMYDSWLVELKYLIDFGGKSSEIYTLHELVENLRFYLDATLFGTDYNSESIVDFELMTAVMNDVKMLDMVQAFAIENSYYNQWAFYIWELFEKPLRVYIELTGTQLPYDVPVDTLVNISDARQSRIYITDYIRNNLQFITMLQKSREIGFDVKLSKDRLLECLKAANNFKEINGFVDHLLPVITDKDKRDLALWHNITPVDLIPAHWNILYLDHTRKLHRGGAGDEPLVNV